MSELALTEPTAPARLDTSSLIAQAEQLAKSDLVPKALRGKPANVFLVLMAGRDLGIPAITALSKVYAIEGAVSIAPELMLALIRREKVGRVWPAPGNDENQATAVAERYGEAERYEYVYTLDDAKRAGLVGKDNWRKYPKQMLWWRAVAGLCRQVFPDVLMGASYLPDELGLVTDSEGNVIDVEDAGNVPPGDRITGALLEQVRGLVADAGFDPDNPADVATVKTFLHRNYGITLITKMSQQEATDFVAQSLAIRAFCPVADGVIDAEIVEPEPVAADSEPEPESVVRQTQEKVKAANGERNAREDAIRALAATATIDPDWPHVGTPSKWWICDVTMPSRSEPGVTRHATVNRDNKGQVHVSCDCPRATEGHARCDHIAAASEVVLAAGLARRSGISAGLIRVEPAEAPL